jgi:acyl-CoA reductase-like NAD-dependent aldehyde dehydrogenase
MYQTSLLIDGKAAAASKGAKFTRNNPITGKPATTAAAASDRDAVAAVKAAQAAFPAWSATSPNARRKILNAAAARLRERSADFAERVAAETGSTVGWGHFNVAFAATMLEEAAAITTQVSGEVIPSDYAGSMSLAVRQPAGVVLGMAPWNAPVILGVRALAVPLAVGNTVVLKASETCPATHHLIGEVLIEAGVPEGAINVVTHSAEDAPAVVEAMIAHPAVRRVNFTGSSRVGAIIGEICGRHLKPVVLELGGKSPLIILDDADLDEAVKAAAFGAFMHQGQICMSTERIVVLDAIADDFIERFKAKAESLVTGDPAKGQFPLAACVDLSSADNVRALVADATKKGAVRVCGGDGDGVFVPPNVIDKVAPGMRLYGEESFGPVVSVVRAKDDDDAVRIANDTEYGLSSAVFSRDIGRALSIARRIESGICHINSPTVQDEAQMPFGGVKASGFGRFGGRAGIDAFTELRWITIATQPRHYPI